jgi:hypothetical protein
MEDGEEDPRELERKIEQASRIVSRPAGRVVLPTDGVDLLAFGRVDDEATWAAERLITDGVCTRAEIERAKNG